MVYATAQTEEAGGGNAHRCNRGSIRIIGVVRSGRSRITANRGTDRELYLRKRCRRDASRHLFRKSRGDVTTDEMESRFAGQCSYRAVDVKPPGVSIADIISLDNVELRVMRIPTREGDRWMFQFVLRPLNSLTR